MTLAIGEFIGALLVAFLFGGVVAAILWGSDIRRAAPTNTEEKRKDL